MANYFEANEKIIKKINNSNYNKNIKEFLKEIFCYELGSRNKIYTDDYIKKIKKFSQDYVD